MSVQLRRTPILTGAFVLLLAVAAGFGAHALWMISTYLVGAQPARIEGWMTPRHIRSAFDLPPETLAPILGLAPGEMPFVTLNDLAAAQGIPSADLVARVQAALDARRMGP
jgi:hypothetical protein